MGPIARRRPVMWAAVPIVASTVLAGCSLQSLGMGSAPRSVRDTTSTPLPSQPARPAPRPARGQGHAAATRYVRGSLAAGTLTHTLSLGARKLVLTYWTGQDVGTWTASTPATVNVSAHIENGSRSTGVLVTQFAATFTPGGSANVAVLRQDRGRFVVTPPYSYVSAVLVPAVPTATRTARMDIQFDLLVAIAPGSREYARQTVLDTLHFSYLEANDD